MPLRLGGPVPVAPEPKGRSREPVSQRTDTQHRSALGTEGACALSAALTPGPRLIRVTLLIFLPQWTPSAHLRTHRVPLRVQRAPRRVRDLSPCVCGVPVCALPSQERLLARPGSRLVTGTCCPWLTVTRLWGLGSCVLWGSDLWSLFPGCIPPRRSGSGKEDAAVTLLGPSVCRPHLPCWTTSPPVDPGRTWPCPLAAAASSRLFLSALF